MRPFRCAHLVAPVGAHGDVVEQALGNREWQRRDGLLIPLTAETGHGHNHNAQQLQGN